MRAIGGAAVVNRLAHFYLEKRGARVTAAPRQIARKRYSYSANRRTRWSCRKAANEARRCARRGPFAGFANAPIFQPACDWLRRPLKQLAGPAVLQQNLATVFEEISQAPGNYCYHDG